MASNVKTSYSKKSVSSFRSTKPGHDLHHGLRALYQTTEELQFSKPLPTLLKAILRGLKNATQLARTAVFTYEDGAECLQGIAGIGISDKKLSAFNLPLESEEESQLLQLSLFADVPLRPNAEKRLTSRIEETFSWKNIAIIPLEIRDRLVGILAYESDELPESLREIVILFARHAAYVIENARLFSKVEEMALRDTLTGLYNRRYLQQILEYEINRSRRYQTPLSLVFIDLDHFKDINDTHGHAMGDKILRQVATRLSQLFRTTDVVGRYAGDEFLAILPSTPPSGVKILADRLLGTLGAYEMMVRGQSIKASVSIGFHTFTGEDGVGSATLIDRADKAMYQAKANGRGCIYGFEDVPASALA